MSRYQQLLQDSGKVDCPLLARVGYPIILVSTTAGQKCIPQVQRQLEPGMLGLLHMHVRRCAPPENAADRTANNQVQLVLHSITHSRYYTTTASTSVIFHQCVLHCCRLRWFLLAAAPRTTGWPLWRHHVSAAAWHWVVWWATYMCCAQMAKTSPAKSGECTLLQHVHSKPNSQLGSLQTRCQPILNIIFSHSMAAIVAFATPAVREHRTASRQAAWRLFMLASGFLDAHHSLNGSTLGPYISTHGLTQPVSSNWKP